MPEYYKKVVCNQFTLTPEDKEAISKGANVTFEGQKVKETGGGRYHILLPMNDRLLPVHEGDWIVRNPEMEIKRDHDFRAQYIEIDSFDPIATQQKLDAFMRDRNQNSI